MEEINNSIYPIMRFSEILDSPPRNGIYKSKEYQGHGTKMVKMNELFGCRWIRATQNNFDRLDLNEKEKSKLLLIDEDLLFSRTSVVADGVGKCSIVYVYLEELIYDSNIIRIRLDKQKANPIYYFYYFNSPQGREQVKSLSSGAAVTTVTGNKIISLDVPYPPLPTQHKIAATLSAYDDLIENNTRRIKILEEMAQALYREWFVHFRFPGHETVRMVDSPLGRIPEGWEVKKLGETCQIIMGQSPKSEFYNEVGKGLPFHQGVTDFGSRFPTHRVYCIVQNRIAEAGDILFSVRAPVGRINIADKTIVIGRGLSAIRSNNDHQIFVFQQLTELFQEEDSMGGGTIFKSVTKEDMNSIKLIIPDNLLLKEFQNIVGPMFSQLYNLAYRNCNLRRTRDLLLPKLISGGLDVEDLNINTRNLNT
jgi:type I restriction enzyme S subunit